MRYFSTRNNKEFFSSSHVILNGIAKDGGLFVCEEFKKIEPEEIKKMVSLKYSEVAYLILKRFLTDFEDDFLKEITREIYSSKRFYTDEIAKVYSLNKEVSFLELWHGKTFAFKDMALQLLPHILKKAAEKEGKGNKILILTSTSGDTGKAALEGFKDVEGTSIFVFFPTDGVSEFQKLSMITQEGENVFISGIDGNFDDAQTQMKEVMVDKEFLEILKRNKIVVSSANSINWARLVSQIVYYFYAYCKMVEKGEIQFKEKINVVVPTGNFGNILACYYAKKMGLFIEDLVVASNKNSIVSDFINAGIYDVNRSFYKTISPSMDILVSSNLERLIFDVCRDEEEVVKIYKEFKETGKFKLKDIYLEKIKSNFFADFCSDDETKKTIKEVFDEYKYLIDPHTAVGYFVYKKYIKRNRNKNKTLIVSTANAFKFSKDVLSALGKDKDFSLEECLNELSKETGVLVPDFFKEVSNKEVRFKEVIDGKEIKSYVLKKLNLV